MTTTIARPLRAKRTWALHLALGIAAVLGAGRTHGEPAQEPLMLRAVQVVPNIMYTLDDSPSMTSIHSRADYSMRLHPAEMDGSADGVVPTTHNPFVAFMRSAGYNQQYYDPAVRYLPWRKPDGTLMDNADPAAVWLRPHPDPSQRTGGPVDLRQVDAMVTTWWCNDEVSGDCPRGERAYTPALYYVYTGARGSDPTVMANWDRVAIMSRTSFPRHPARVDCAGTTCTQAEELQNFANWFAYYRNRIHTAIAGTTAAFSGLGHAARVGWGAINARVVPGRVDGGGDMQHTIVNGIRQFTGTDRNNFFDWAYRFRTRGYTPLRRAVADVGGYFQRTDNRGPWGANPGTDDQAPHLSCRRNYHVLVTDGAWNMDSWAPAWSNADYDSQVGPLQTAEDGRTYQYTPVRPYASNQTWYDGGVTYNSLADVTHYLWSRDLRPDLPNNITPTAANPAFWQHLTHYTVGLGVRGILNPGTDLPRLINGTRSWGASRIDDLWHAAINSRGEYVSAQRPEEFSDKLRAVMDSIAINATLAGVTASSKRLRAGTRKYVAEFTSDTWSGELHALVLDANGVASETPVWSASSLIPAPADRKIFFWKGGTSRARPFAWSELGASQQAALGSEAVLDYLRGDRSAEGVTMRKRTRVLGDVVNSTPLYVKDVVDQEYDFLPASAPGRGSYRSFLTAMKSRPGAVYVGANDGMLHMFQETLGASPGDGTELFAFVPGELLPKLKQLSEGGYVHKYYVDGELAEHHAYLGTAWKSVLTGTLAAGGRAVFALDVTSPAGMGASSVLWEINQSQDADLGHVYSAPVLGVLQNGRWVALFGNGEGGASNRAQLWVVDAATGEVLRKIDTGSGSVAAPNGLSGVKPILNGARQVVGAYAGDAQGNVWKFNLSGATPGEWSVDLGGLPLFQARTSTGAVQPITVAPQYVLHPSGGNVVVVATGRLMTTADAVDTTTQTLYGLWDKGVTGSAATIGGRSDLVAQTHGATLSATADGVTTQYFTTSQNDVPWGSKRGWYLDFTVAPGQRTIYPLSFFFGRVRAETVYLTGGNEQCQTRNSGGVNYLLDPLTGKMPASALVDVNGDGLINASDPPVSAYKASADGVDTIVVAGDGKAKIISAGKNPKLISDSVPRKRNWRKLFMMMGAS